MAETLEARVTRLERELAELRGEFDSEQAADQASRKRGLLLRLFFLVAIALFYFLYLQQVFNAL